MIEKIEVESFSTDPNAAVIKLPGRKFPGAVIQGDSLKILIDCLENASILAKRLGDSQLQESVEELENLLTPYLRAYEETLRANGQLLPYVP